jgi:actin-related protein
LIKIGGTTLIKGFHERFVKEFQKILDEKKNISKIVTKIDNPKYGAYVGASVITTLSNYGYSTYLMKHKYDSEGKGVCHKHNFQKLVKVKKNDDDDDDDDLEE